MTLPRSLLQKSLVAQEIFDKKFLLPSAPESPNFFLVPGENQVTVVWEPSATEYVGDPFYAVASDPTSSLFDPNFRQFDVEGYRIYRGRTAGDLQSDCAVRRPRELLPGLHRRHQLRQLRAGAGHLR